jgi:phosphoglycerate dehydrogenase-like enzyme
MRQAAKMIVLDDYEGELANAPAMIRLRQLAEVQILDRPIHPDDNHILKDVQILLALRERTKLDSRFFEACPKLELVLQTGGHAYHIDQTAASCACLSTTCLQFQTWFPFIFVYQMSPAVS